MLHGVDAVYFLIYLDRHQSCPSNSCPWPSASARASVSLRDVGAVIDGPWFSAITLSGQGTISHTRARASERVSGVSAHRPSELVGRCLGLII